MMLNLMLALTGVISGRQVMYSKRWIRAHIDYYPSVQLLVLQAHRLPSALGTRLPESMLSNKMPTEEIFSTS